MPHMIFPKLLAAAVLSAVAATAATAHHGWSWAEADQIELTGTIRSISFAPPHPTLEVEAEDGLWRLELGNPNQTQRSGFVEGEAEVGDTIRALGNRSMDPGERRMKAVRITVGDKTYDIYPDRIQSK